MIKRKHEFENRRYTYNYVTIDRIALFLFKYQQACNIS